MRLPVKVRPPIRIDRTMVTREKVDDVGLSAAQPTSSEAMPPKPLNSATISGIEVILTSRAAAAPITPPAAKPITIH